MKRIFLLVATNFGVMAVLFLTFNLIQAVFGVTIGGGSFTGIAITSLLFGFGFLDFNLFDLLKIDHNQRL